MARKETNPERIVREELTRRGIEFVQEYPVRIGRRRWSYYVDFYLPWQNTCLDVDGDYWHTLKGQKEIDDRKDKRLRALKFIVVRVSETEVLANVSLVIDKILCQIEKSQNQKGT